MLAASVAALNHRTRGHDRAQALQEVFARYDKDASGSIHYHEFVSLANQAFEQVNANASHPLNGSHVGKCSVHGPSQAFRVDGFCIDCELGAMEHQSELLPPVPVRRGIEGATAQLNGGALPFADDAPSAKSWLLAHAASSHQVVVDRDEARRKLKASSAQSAGKSMTKGWASAASVAAAKSAYVCVCLCVCVCVCVYVRVCCGCVTHVQATIAATHVAVVVVSKFPACPSSTAREGKGGSRLEHEAVPDVCHDPTHHPWPPVAPACSPHAPRLHQCRYAHAKAAAWSEGEATGESVQLGAGECEGVGFSVWVVCVCVCVCGCVAVCGCVWFWGCGGLGL